MTEYFHGLFYGDNESYATMVCTDDRFSYDIVPATLFKEEEGYEPKGSADKDVEWVDRDKLDWSVVLDGGDLDEKGIPLSWLSVDNEAEGRQWYKKHTKMPDSMIDYVARYYWGDGLVPREAASTTKVGRKKKGATPKFECHKGSFFVEF